MPEIKFPIIYTLSKLLLLALIGCSQDGKAREDKISSAQNNLKGSLSPYLLLQRNGSLSAAQVEDNVSMAYLLNRARLDAP